ncbi:hypothetical protein S83_001267, partial [Arachis hypogaea]
LGHLYCQYFERSTPYGRVPLRDKCFLSTRTEIGTFMTPPPTSSETSTRPPSKKKRNLSGNP